MKKLIMGALAVFMLFIMTSCDGMFDTFTVSIRNYADTDIYSVEFRLVDSTEWSKAKLVDEEGTEYGILNPVEDLETAYFSVPGLGEYEFKALSITGLIIGPHGLGDEENIITEEVLYPDNGLDSTIDLSVSDTSTSVHG